MYTLYFWGVCDRLANPVDLVKVQQQAVVGQHPDIRNGRTFVMLHEIYLNQGVAGESCDNAISRQRG